jgi:MYXO-CTERM domain-containing protein
MPSATHTSPRVLAALALGSILTVPGATWAAPPGASDFQITYRFTDDDGMVLQSQRLVQNDLNQYVNRARCQCGEKLAAQVFLKPSQAGPYDQVQVRTFVGSNCAQGQVGNTTQYGPCVQTSDAQPNAYDDQGMQIVFDLAWLSSSVVRGTDQTAAMPELDDPCGGAQSGDAGLWVCVEDQMTTGCQENEFVINGTQNENGSGGSTGSTDPTQGDGMSAGGIHFDYQPPQVSITGFRASAGDGRVEIAWDSAESTDFNGFRVLCADLDGNPVPGKGASEPTGSRRALGQLYFTADNLCPGAVVYASSDEVPVDTDTGSDDRGTDASGTGMGSTAGASDTGMGSTTGASTTGATTTGASDTADATGGGVVDSPLANLDWDYVCSDHVSRTGTNAEIGGLENGKEYQFLVVAYDLAGNPLIVSDVLTATPVETSDFWEQCEQQDDICGSGGFCACTSEPEPTNAAWFGAGLVLLGLARRRRGPRR